MALGDGVFRMEVTDDGIGLPPVRRAGVGLASMAERATELGGTCRVEALQEGGTRVSATLPIPSNQANNLEHRTGWSGGNADGSDTADIRTDGTPILAAETG